MKKFLLSLAASSLAVAAVSSCSDFLAENPTTSYMETSVYKTESSLESLVYGLYRLTFSSTSSTEMFYNFGCSSMFIHWKRGNRSGRQYEQYLRGTLYADQTNGASIFRAQFSAIQSCNTILEGLETSPVDEQYKTEIKAEVLLLRAINYFYAVRMFGDVPLFTSPIKSDKDSYVKRTAYNKVYGQIIEDLKYAALYMRDEARQTEVAGQNGRACKYAATAFLAEVYLQIGSLLASPDDQAFGTVETGYERPDFSQQGIASAQDAFTLALKAADEVIFHGPYELEPDFRTLFCWEPSQSPNAFFSKERIFAMQNTPNGGTAARFTMNTLPNFMYGTLQSQTLHTCSTAGYIRPPRFVLDKWARTYGGKPSQAGGLVFYTDCQDPRYDATYITKYQVTASSSGAVYDPPRDVSMYPFDNGDDPYFRKYFCSDYDADAAYADFYVLRLAQIYLVAAEACARAGIVGEQGWDAYTYVDKVHARARGELSATAVQSEYPRWNTSFSTTEELVSAIFWEIIYETHGEGQEWFNSHRNGGAWIVENVYEPIHQFMNEPEQESYREQWWYNLGYELPRTEHNARCGLLCEYPEYELQYNQALSTKDQNVFNSQNAQFAVNASASDTNESYDDEEDIFPW